MSNRFVAGVSMLATLVGIAWLASVPLAGQSSSSRTNAPGDTKTRTVPKTAWGDPDLQGTWSYASLTPLERPAAMKEKEFFTPEEAVAREAAQSEDAPPRKGDVGAYNAHWFDRGKVDSKLRTSLIIDPPDGRLPLTPEAQKAVAARAAHRRDHPADSWLDRTIWDRCITYHGVPPIATGYNNTYQILQTPGYVAILVENIHDVRIIPLDGRPKLSDNIQQWNGDSRGRWEGNTLVVETANYSEKSEMRFPTSKNTRAVERFTRIDADTIEHKFTVTDPTVYTKPWTAVRAMPRLPDYKIYEYACHEGNYAMPGILGGERAMEKAAEEKRKSGSR